MAVVLAVVAAVLVLVLVPLLVVAVSATLGSVAAGAAAGAVSGFLVAFFLEKNAARLSASVDMAAAWLGRGCGWWGCWGWRTRSVWVSRVSPEA
jgi:hypothetical protein